MGEPLLTPSLGFPSLESLLRSLPDVCTLRHSGGQLVVMGVASSATAHVQDMVAKQNTARRGKRRGGGVGGAVCRGRSGRGAAGQYSEGRGGRGFKTSNAYRGFSGAFNGDVGEAYSGLSGGRGREFGRSSWSGKPLYARFQAPNRNACREESGAWRPAWVPAHQDRVQQSNDLPETLTQLRRRMSNAKVLCPESRTSVSRKNTFSGVKHDVLQVTRGGVEMFGSRVAQILRGRIHGLYQMQVESQYKKNWGEELPDSWLDTMAGSDCGFVTEKVGAHLLCRVREENKEKQLCQVVDNDSNGQPANNASKEAPSVSSTPFPQRCATLPPPKVHQICSNLQWPKEEDYYDVRVCFVPVGGITFMVQDFSRRWQYEQLEEDMSSFYNEMVNRRPLKAEDLRGGSLVAVRQGKRWQRARVLPSCASSPLTFQQSPFNLLLVDNGRLVVRHNVADLQWLWSRFGMLEEGAAKARLAGVKPLEVGVWGSKAENWLRTRLLGKDMVSLVVAREQDLMFLKLVDTSGEPEDDMDVAEEMVAEGFAFWIRSDARACTADED